MGDEQQLTEVRRPRIVLMDGEQGVREYRLERQRTSIGRSALNQIVLEHQSVSQFHAHILAEARMYRITDLGTRHGIQVNGRKVEKAVLEPGDEILIGEVVLRFMGEDTRAVMAPDAGHRPKWQWQVSRRAVLGIVILAGVLALLVAVNAYWIAKLAGGR